jgi:hypothetical protein
MPLVISLLLGSQHLAKHSIIGSGLRRKSSVSLIRMGTLVTHMHQRRSMSVISEMRYTHGLDFVDINRNKP